MTQSSQKHYEDNLERKELAHTVLETLLAQESVKVMSLNGAWGSGKTYFLDFMREHAETKGILFITHNVWENDYLDDPFLSIMAEFESQVTELLKPLTEISPMTWVEKEPFVEYKEALPKIIQHLDSLKEKGKALLQSTQLSGFGASVDIGGIFKNPTPELKDYQKLKQAKESFKNSLKDLIKEIPQDKNGNKRPLIIAIDEVDRTRPEYAIRTLEVIKHFFDIEGLQFILSVDKKQLQNTVKQMFGQDTETDCYLRKFVDLEWNLPAPPLELFIIAQLKKLEPLFSKHEGYIYFNRTRRSMASDKTIELYRFTTNQDKFKNRLLEAIMLWLDKHPPMSLRDIEKWMQHLKIILGKIPSQDLVAIEMLLDLVWMYKKHTRLFHETELYLKEHFEKDPEYDLTKEPPRPYQTFGLFISNYRADAKLEEKHFENIQTVVIDKAMKVLNQSIKYILYNGDPQDFISNTDRTLVVNLLGSTLYHYYQAIRLSAGYNEE
jgi:hypothetical protein